MRAQSQYCSSVQAMVRKKKGDLCASLGHGGAIGELKFVVLFSFFFLSGAVVQAGQTVGLQAMTAQLRIKSSSFSVVAPDHVASGMPKHCIRLGPAFLVHPSNKLARFLFNLQRALCSFFHGPARLVFAGFGPAKRELGDVYSARQVLKTS